MTLTKSQQVEQREKEAQVLELRKAGATFGTIARALGYADPSGAKRAYDRAMLATIQQPAAEIRALELERLDALMKALWTRAMTGNTDAIDRCLSIMARRAKMLGLDQPTRSEVTVITRDAIERAIIDLEAELGSNDPSRSSDREAAVPARVAGGTRPSGDGES